jgi:YgiT-type zinc finger domain-containing protein
MECVVCKNGTTEKGFATFTLEKNDCIVVFKKVPAIICQNCGHAYFSEEITAQLFEMAEETVAKGVEVEVRTLKTAS